MINYFLDIILVYYDCLKQAGENKELLGELLIKKRLVFISKLSEFPMLFYYL